MNPLDQLEPLIDPAPIAFWPPAPGWWLLLLVIVLLIAVACWLYRRQQKRPKTLEQTSQDPLRQAALKELAQLQKPYHGQPAGPWLQQLNALLKRLCREHYPESGSHLLSSRAWLAFLDTRCPAAGLTRWMVLVDGAYKPHCTLTDKAITELDQAVAIWINKHV